MQDAYVVSAVRTPIGRFGGALKDEEPSDLAAHAMRAALERAGVAGKHLDLFLFGNVLRAGHGQLVPRQGAIKAGIPKEIDGMAVDMVCASGMATIYHALSMIRAEEADLVLTGGVESMSGSGFYLPSDVRWGNKMGHMDVVDVMVRDGLSDPFDHDAMGVQTERVAAEHGITRDVLDEVAAQSQQRAHTATVEGLFQDEIVPVEYEDRRETKTLERDEGIREGITKEKLSSLSPAFTKDGVLTAGNSSQISDGAAALLVASARAVEARGLRPIARILGGAWAAGEPYQFTSAPIGAAERLLDKLHLDVEAFDLVENNEAFALNNVLFHRELGVPYDKLNVHGGAVALGHPIGCSGARIVVTLLHALRRRDGRYGLAAICHGTGGGFATAYERV